MPGTLTDVKLLDEKSASYPSAPRRPLNLLMEMRGAQGILRDNPQKAL